MAQPETGGVSTTEDEGDKLVTPSDDEEITIPSQERDNLRNINIRGEQSENTQREDWLLPTEPRHGARPRQTPTSANFATALEMLAMKALGDMGQTDPLQLIRDRFIAGHNSCDLRRHLDSAPPETPIRDVVDRFHVWESHADPAISRTRKPTPDPIYPTFTVGEKDSNNEITRVAAVNIS